MPEFYQNLITEKSYKLLQDLKREFNFILIGGWAVFLYTGALKSKDIDMIVEYQELERLRKKFDLFKNERLKKYEVKQEEIDIDIYLPYYSNLGLPVEEIGNYAIVREGFKVPKIEVLLILKQFVFSQRQGSAKGKKDCLDILSLLKLREVDWDFYQELLMKYKLEGLKENLINLIKETKRAPELDLNEYKIAKLKEDLFNKFNKLELFK